jgi:amino acid transporter
MATPEQQGPSTEASRPYGPRSWHGNTLKQVIGLPAALPSGSAIWIRALVTFVLLLTLVFVVVWGITKGVRVQDVGAYAAPISGLAGIAVGYWFGTGTRAPLPMDDRASSHDRRTPGEEESKPSDTEP